MDRRTYIRSTVGVAVVAAGAGCLQGEAVLHKTRISTSPPTKEWEVELAAGNRMRLEVEKTGDFSGRLYGYVHRVETGEEIARTRSGGPDDTFDVPATGTYIVSIDPNGAAEGEIILRNLN